MAHLAKVCAAACLLSIVSAFGDGCAAPADDAERFREALPSHEEVALGVPKNGTGVASQGLHIATNATPTSTARFYQMTRDITGAVDFTTALILGGVWAIVHTAPTSLEPKKIVWGPGSGNALEPAIWRFTANEIGDSEYDYTLEGQLKSGGGWMTVLSGHGYGMTRPEHRQGWFRVDNDAYKALEPTRGHDQGTTKVTYDLRQVPTTIAVELRPFATTARGWVDVLVTHNAGGAGEMTVKGLTDLDPAKTTKLEDLQLVSRWAGNGSGRADALFKSGDLPITVTASECWSTSFARVYYKDTVNLEAPTGDSKVCSFDAAKL